MHDIVITSVPPEADSRRVLLAAVAICVFFSAVFIGWGMIAQLNGAVHAQGTIIVDSHRKTVQHLEGGIVQSILVKDGDRVAAGQPLLVLAAEQAKASVELFSGQRDGELASEARLTAEKNDAASVTFPRELLARRSEPAVAEILHSEEKLFAAKLNAFNGQVDILKNQLSQVREEIKGLAKQQEENARELSALEQQLASHRELLKKKYVTKTALLELERTQAEKAGNGERLTANIAQDREKLAELNSKIAGLKSTRIQDAADELKKSQIRRLELEDRTKAPRDTLNRLVVRAPIGGKIVDLKVTTVGGVIASREPLMDIVPDEDRLIVDAHVSVDDITELAPGQLADIILPAYKSSTTPPVSGKVVYIGADRLVAKGPTGDTPYYPVHLEIDQASLKQSGINILQPGMSATVQIRTKARTALDYLLTPLFDRYRKALHDK
jgi:HlyD family type I secretion membrane fusion protein